MSMDLATRRAELERLGFRVVNEDATSLVATRAKWHWECFMTKLTVVALVRRVPSVTADNMNADEKWLHDKATKLDPSALPRGFQKGRAFVSVYLADQVDHSAVERAQRKPTLQFATFFMPAVRDAAGNMAWFKETPFVGAVYYPILQFIVRRLLDPSAGAEKEPPSKVGVIMTLVLVVLPLIACACIPAMCLLSAAFQR